MVSKTESYYIIKLENILTYMENSDYYNDKFRTRVIKAKNNIIRNGLTNKNIKEVQDINTYFVDEVYSQKGNSLAKGLNNIWSKYKNELRGK